MVFSLSAVGRAALNDVCKKYENELIDKITDAIDDAAENTTNKSVIRLTLPREYLLGAINNISRHILQYGVVTNDWFHRKPIPGFDGEAPFRSVQRRGLTCGWYAIEISDPSMNNKTMLEVHFTTPKGNYYFNGPRLWHGNNSFPDFMQIDG